MRPVLVYQAKTIADEVMMITELILGYHQLGIHLPLNNFLKKIKNGGTYG